MTLENASKYYKIEYERMALYEQKGLISGIKTENGTDYSDTELQKISLIDLLREANFSFEEIRFYLSDTDNAADIIKKILLLKRQRSEVLDEIHVKQKILQNLDYLIHETEKKKS